MQTLATQQVKAKMKQEWTSLQTSDNLGQEKNTWNHKELAWHMTT